MITVDPNRSPTVGELSNMIDPADRRTLARYDDDKRLWFLIQSDQLSLAEVAWAGLHDGEAIKSLLKDGLLLMAKSFQNIPGENFYCIFFEDAYWLTDYNTGKK